MDFLHPIRFKTSTGELYEVDWPDVNVLLLTAEDCVWLWSQKISW